MINFNQSVWSEPKKEVLVADYKGIRCKIQKDYKLGRALRGDIYAVVTNFSNEKLDSRLP